eukprot:g16184.t1
MAHLVEKQGWLWKKSPAGLKGFRRWQKRWFVIGQKAITYYTKETDIKPLGSIPLLQIVACEYIPDKRIGCRFDIRMKNMRVYAMDGSFVEDARSWVLAINRAVQRAQTERDIDPANAESTALAARLTPLQFLYAKARFAGGIHTKTIPPEQETQIFQAMREHFPTDGHVLKWLLDNTMHPDKGVFVWDVRSDKQLADQNAQGEHKGVAEGESETPGGERSRHASGVEGAGETGNPEQKTDKPPCRVPSCKNAMFWNSAGQQLQLCVAHLNDMQCTRGKDAQPTLNDHLIDMLRSPDFRRCLLKVFEKPDSTTHGLAVRLLWTLFRGLYDREEAQDQMRAYTSIHCSGPRFTPDISIALLNLILTEPRQIHENVELTVAFYMPVVNKSVWSALFGCMSKCDFETRKITLEDINTILHDNFDNCASLRTIDKWQDLVYNLFTDIPKTKAADPTVKTVFAYCINVLTLVHFQYFMKSTLFYQVLRDALYSLHMFGGSNLEGQQVGTVLLSALCSKLASRRKAFSSVSYKNMEWVNLKQLTRICRKYIFQTAFWNVPVSPDTFAAEAKEATTPTTGERTSFAETPATAQRRLLIEFRNAQRQKASPYVLQKNHTEKDQPTFYDETEGRDYGFHWNDAGECSDVGLVKKLMSMFRAIGLDKYSPELSSSLRKEDKEFLLTAEKEYQFWEDALVLCEMVSRKDIEELKILTYRRVSVLVQAFIAAGYNKSERKNQLKEMLTVNISAICVRNSRWFPPPLLGQTRIQRVDLGLADSTQVPYPNFPASIFFLVSDVIINFCPYLEVSILHHPCIWFTLFTHIGE